MITLAIQKGSIEKIL